MNLWKECRRNADVKKKKGKGPEGSLTIEAALSLTLFMFMVILLSVPMELLNVQRKVQMVLETAAREMSRQAWLPDSEDEGWISLFLQGGLILSLEHAIEDAVGENRLEKLDCSGTRISEDREWIDLRAEYRLKLPFSVFALDSIPLSARSRKRGWIGREGGYWSRENTEERNRTMVYVGRDSVRYHLSADCHYLSNQIIAVSSDQVDEMKSKDGSHYKLCRICGGEVREGGMVYLFPNGAYYHSRKDCSSVRFYIREVPLDEVRHLGACSYCGGQK